MKKALLLPLLALVVPLAAGLNEGGHFLSLAFYSKLSSTDKEQGQQQPDTSEPDQSFNGEKLSGVYITEDHKSIYTVSKEYLREWNFAGNQIINEYDLSTLPEKNWTPHLTENTCYLIRKNIIKKFLMKNHDATKTISMKNSIERASACKAGLMVYTNDGMTTLFNTDLNPEGSSSKIYPVDRLDTGEIFASSESKKLYIVDSKKDSDDAIKFPTRYALSKICKKKGSNNRLLVVYPHSVIENGGVIEIFDIQNGTSKQVIQTSIFPDQWDVKDNLLAIAGSGQNESTIKLFDIETGKQLYDKSCPIYGTSALRLGDNTIYYVGDKEGKKEGPQSMAFDLRQDQLNNNETPRPSQQQQQ